MSTEQISAPSRPADHHLWLELSVRDSVAVINLQGEPGRGTGHLLTELVEHVAGGRPSRVVLDLAQVQVRGSDGLVALRRARNLVSDCGASFVLRAPARG